MKKIAAGMVLLILILIGFLFHQYNEKTIQIDLYEEASVFFKEEDYRKAIQLFEEASAHQNLFSGRLDEDLLYYQAEAYLKLEEYEEAIEIYDTLIGEKPKDEIAYVMKAYCLAGAGQGEEAAAVYEQGYKNTKEQEFLYYLANQYVTMEEYESALEIIEDYKSGDTEVVRKLAFLEIVIYEKQLDYDTAYEKACAYCEAYPEDENGRKEMLFLESR